MKQFIFVNVLLEFTFFHSQQFGGVEGAFFLTIILLNYKFYVSNLIKI